MEVHLDLLTNIVFGVTSGLLSLVGLIAIFITLNTQYNTEKAREILWELNEAYQFFEFVTAEKKYGRIRWLIERYRKLIKVERPIKISIYISVITIFLVAIVWVSFLLLTTEFFKSPTYFYFALLLIIVACLILCSFIILLGKLQDISNLVSIPSNYDMIDATFKLEKYQTFKNLSIADLALIDSRIIIHKYKGNSCFLDIHRIINISSAKINFSFTYKNGDNHSFDKEYNYGEEDLFVVMVNGEELRNVEFDFLDCIVITLDVFIKDQENTTLRCTYYKNMNEFIGNAYIIDIYPTSLEHDYKNK